MLFSIITPTFNRGYIIGKAIESVRQQDFYDWEMIIIDDASTDNTFETIKEFLNDKIKYFRLPQNSGPNVARNFGAEKANGEWLIFLDSDDELTHNALTTIKDYINKYPDVSFFIFACRDLDGNIPINIKTYEGYITYKDFLCKIKGEALPVIKREIFLTEKFQEKVRGGENITWIRILKNNQKGFFSNKVLRIYNNKLPDRLSVKKRNFKRLMIAYLLFFKNFYKDLLKLCPIKLILTSVKIVIYMCLSLIFNLNENN